MSDRDALVELIANEIAEAISNMDAGRRVADAILSSEDFVVMPIERHADLCGRIEQLEGMIAGAVEALDPVRDEENVASALCALAASTRRCCPGRRIVSDARTYLAWEIAAGRWSDDREPGDSDFALADRIIASRNLIVLTLEDHAALCGQIEALQGQMFEAAMQEPQDVR